LRLEFLHADEVGVLLGIQLKKPLEAAERMPFRLAEMIFGIEESGQKIRNALV
jgi:hypothetical protein